MNPLTLSALQAHYDTVADEGGERIVKEYNTFAGYNVAIVHMAGAELLVIRPNPRPDNAYNIALDRRDIAEYIAVDGGIEPFAWQRFPYWLVQMGKEITVDECVKLGDVLTHAWTDFYNLQPVTLNTKPKNPIGEFQLMSADGKVLRHREI